MAIELTISDLRNLDEADSSLLFAVDGDTETFSLSVNTLFEYTRQRLGYLETGGVEMYLGEVIPPTHTELDGKSFDPLVYPKMGALFPSGKLPDTRGMMLKHAPNGRSVLSFEAESIKAHAHGITVNSTDLGTKSAASAGAHTHSQRGGTGSGNYYDRASGAYSGSTFTNSSGIFSSGEHTHSVVIGSHSHTATCATVGGSKNLVDNIAVKFIIKKA